MFGMPIGMTSGKFTLTVLCKTNVLKENNTVRDENCRMKGEKYALNILQWLTCKEDWNVFHLYEILISVKGKMLHNIFCNE